MLEILKKKLKNASTGSFFNKTDLEKVISVTREILEDLISDLLEYRNSHSKLHYRENRQFEKRIKKLEKRIKDLELKK